LTELETAKFEVNRLINAAYFLFSVKRFVHAQHNRSSSEDRADATPGEDPYSSSALCPICFEEFVDREVICISRHEECPHRFHVPCIFDWLLKSPDCPCCRRNYLVNEQTRKPEDIEAGSAVEDGNLEIYASLRQELTPQEILTITNVLTAWV
jgi:Ring finger domain